MPSSKVGIKYFANVDSKQIFYVAEPVLFKYDNIWYSTMAGSNTDKKSEDRQKWRDLVEGYF